MITKTSTVVRLVCVALLLLPPSFQAAAQDYFSNPDSLEAFLASNFSNSNSGMVVGLLDEHGTKIFSAGKLDDGTDAKVNGDTIFEIGSCTKVFTSLLALDMARRGKIEMNDPVTKFLPPQVKVPSFEGHPITFRHLAAQESGLPWNPHHLEKALNRASGKPSLKDMKKAAGAYTVPDLYRFLANHKLKAAPGSGFQYSNVGMALLGHVMALNSGESYESLIVKQIAHPLGMDSTRITLTPEQRSRLARGHWANGAPSENIRFQVMEPAGSLLSTTNDLFKFLSATLGLTQSDHRQSMEEMQLVRHTQVPKFGTTAMPWHDNGVYQPRGSELLGHGGGGFGYLAFIGFDKIERRGVVVMSNQLAVNSSGVGWAILQSMPLSRMNVSILVREIAGLGVALNVDKTTGLLNITRVFPESPAGKAGLTTGLMIQSINNVSVKEKSLQECLEMMGGGVGTKVRINVISPITRETKIIEMTRQKFVTTTG